MISQEQIKEWNDYFNSLDPAQKRIAIAKDVLANLETNKIVPHKGRGYIWPTFNNDTDLQAQAHLDELTCTVCALGAVLISLVKYTNDATVREIAAVTCVDAGRLWERLATYFSLQQLFLIECAYEKWDANYILNQECGVALALHYKYTIEDLKTINSIHVILRKFNKTERLKYIMQSIIKNGEFALPQEIEF